MNNVNNQYSITLQQEFPIEEKPSTGNENPEIHVQNPENPEIHVENRENPILEIKDQNNDLDKIVISRVSSSPKGFWGRWGSFIEFLRFGRVMDKEIHLKDKYGVDDEIKCIENPKAKLKPESENVELHIQEEGEELPSPLSLFNHNEPVRPKHITDKEENVVVDNPGLGLPDYTKTIYTIDDIYQHTMIDEKTRTEQEDFWVDKEYKCFTIAGVSLGIVIVALIALPIIAAIIVAAVAAAAFALVVYRVREATPEVYAWRDTLHEYYALRQEIGFNQLDTHDGARRLHSHYQNNNKEDLIGKIFHPKEAWKFWQDEWTSYEKKIKENLGDEGKFNDTRLHTFFRFNPYSSYNYITKQLKDREAEHQKHLPLAMTYHTLKSAFNNINANYADQIQDLSTYEKREVDKKSKYEEKIQNAYDEMMKELGPEPKAAENDPLPEGRKEWIEKRDDIDFVKGYYINQIDEGFKKRKEAFTKWHTDRKNEVENNKNISRQELLEPVQAWWDLRQDFNKEGWDIEAVKIPETIHDEQSTEPPHDLPEPLPFEKVVIKLEGKPLEESGIDLILAQNFNAKIK